MEAPGTPGGGVLTDVVAYVEVWSANGTENYSKTFTNQLVDMGAKVSKTFNKQVTHVVFKDGYQSTWDKAQKRGVKLVSVLWVEKCRTAGAHIDESLFPAANTREHLPSLIKKKRKCMQPKDFIPKTPEHDKRLQKKFQKMATELQRQKTTLDNDVPVLLFESNGSLIYSPTIKMYSGQHSTMEKRLQQMKEKRENLSPTSSQLLEKSHDDTVNSLCGAWNISQDTLCSDNSFSGALDSSFDHLCGNLGCGSQEKRMGEVDEIRSGEIRRTGRAGSVPSPAPPAHLRHLTPQNPTGRLPEQEVGPQRGPAGEAVSPDPDKWSGGASRELFDEKHGLSPTLCATKRRPSGPSGAESCLAKRRRKAEVSGAPPEGRLPRKRRRGKPVRVGAERGRPAVPRPPERAPRSPRSRAPPAGRRLEASPGSEHPLPAGVRLCEAAERWFFQGRRSEKKAGCGHEVHPVAPTLFRKSAVVPGSRVLRASLPCPLPRGLGHVEDPGDGHRALQGTAAFGIIGRKSSHFRAGETSVLSVQNQVPLFYCDKIKTQRCFNLSPVSPPGAPSGKLSTGNTQMFSEDCFSEPSLPEPASTLPEGVKNGPARHEVLGGSLEGCQDLTRPHEESKKRGKGQKPTRTLVMTSMPSETQNIVIQVVNTLKGFSLAQEVCETTTHVLAGKPLRTLNVLLGIARGCWVLSYEWVLWSLELGHWISEEPFELSNYFPAAPLCRLERCLSAGQYQGSLFADQPVMFITPASNPPRPKLWELVLLCGGQITRIPRQAGIFIGPSQGKRKATVKYLSETWILDSITQHQICASENYLLLQ
ncbi:microcephalin [Crocuta crocuta]